MKFEEVMPALRDGRKVRRASWTSTWCFPPDAVTADDLLADDWTVVKEPLTDEELIAVWEDQAASLVQSRHYDVAEAYRTCAHELRTRGVKP